MTRNLRKETYTRDRYMNKFYKNRNIENEKLYKNRGKTFLVNKGSLNSSEIVIRKLKKNYY